MADHKPTLSERDLTRFWAKVALPNANGCMLWLARPNAHGYGQLAKMHEGKQYTLLAHRVMFDLAHGDIPDGHEIYHACGIRACVAPDHLRAVTRKQNCENQGGAYRTSKSGVRGVSWVKHSRKWVARVQHHGYYHYLGLFDTIEEADAAATAKRAELFTHSDREKATA